MATVDKPKIITVAEAKKLLAKYIENNPHSKIEESTPDDVSPYIKLPWGDPSIEIRIPPDHAPLITALESVILPERFSALWHVDTKSFEIIYTAYPLLGALKDVIGRKFSFMFGDKEYQCEFSKPSDRLLAIAENYVRVSSSITDYRNLHPFWNYARAEKGIAGAAKIPGAVPLCFWIKGLEWNEEKCVDIAMHLNFYMTYYDFRNPTINVFPPKQEKSEFKIREQYVVGYFPKEIRGKELNLNLMHFWAQTRKADALRRFQYCYQIVEHASFYFVEEKVKRALHKALSLPHIHHELENIIVEVMDNLAETKTWEGTKMQKLLSEAVEPKLIWKEIEKNKKYFSTQQEFEGGFKLRSLISANQTEESFCNNWEGNFCKDLRDIRNSLSHGREQSTSGVILPTAANISKIEPWVGLASVVAGQVMIFQPISI